jgi:hypothetical protein
MRNFLVLTSLLVVSCSTVDTDRGSNNRAILTQTRIDFTPLSRVERDKFLQFEKQNYEANTGPLKQELEKVTAARTERYEHIKGQFPDCEKQKHCLSTLAHGNVKDFERYTALSKSLQEFDIKAIDLMANIKGWEMRYELRARSINNRFLARELLLLPNVDRRIVQLRVHSMEAFDSRKPLSMRLLRLAGVDTVASIWGDLNFQMFGRPIDEAAVIAAYDVLLANPDPAKQKEPEHFVVTFLINVQEADQLGYEENFLKYWSGLLAEPMQLAFRQRALCGFYSIAGDTLIGKLAGDKAKICALERSRAQTRPSKGQYEAEEWILPLGYVKISTTTGQ